MRVVSCSICGGYHPARYRGDCRDNENRYTLESLPEDTVVISEDDEGNEFDDSITVTLNVLDIIDLAERLHKETHESEGFIEWVICDHLRTVKQVDFFKAM